MSPLTPPNRSPSALRPTILAGLLKHVAATPEPVDDDDADPNTLRRDLIDEAALVWGDEAARELDAQLPAVWPASHETSGEQR